MRLVLAFVAGFWLLFPPFLGADSSRSSEVVDLTRLVLLRRIQKGWISRISPTGVGLAFFDNNVVRLIDTTRGRVVQSLSGHAGRIHDCAWSPDGRLFATTGFDATVRVWEITSGKPLLVLHPHVNYACSVAFSGDGKWLATGGSEDGQVRIFDVASGRAILSIPTAEPTVYELEFACDDRCLVTAHPTRNRTEDSLRVFRTADGSEVKGVSTGPVCAFAVSKDGSALAYANPGGTIVLMETRGWSKRHRLEGHSLEVSSIAFHRSGRYLAAAEREGTVRIWDVASEDLVNTLSVPKEGDSRLRFCSDGSSLVVSSPDAIVRVYGRPLLHPEILGRFVQEDQSLAPTNSKAGAPPPGALEKR